MATNLHETAIGCDIIGESSILNNLLKAKQKSLKKVMISNTKISYFKNKT